jgi:SAM-dependent methyltransferase
MPHTTERNTTLLAGWKTEEQAPFSGWDFSYLDGRMFEDQPPWSYPQRADELLQGAVRALDMGTGGGERILELRSHWPPVLVATEDYAPNVYLSGRRLASEGGSVVVARHSDTHPLPFANGVYDVVLNRHSGLNAAEVARILARNGRFYTQQIHGLWAADLLTVFDASPQWPDSTAQKYTSRLEAAGLAIVDQTEWMGRMRFMDVGAIVYYLKAVPWLVPGFSVETHGDALLRLQAQLERGEPLVYSIGKYVIEARKDH